MLTIITKTDQTTPIESIIESVDRLNELVKVSTTHGTGVFNKYIEVNKDSIIKPLDWHDTEPPYIFPEITFSTENLLAVIFYSIGNPQKAFEYINKDNPLFDHLLIAANLQFGYEIDDNLLQKVVEPHNRCVVHHYGNVKNRWDFEQLANQYEALMESVVDPEKKIFTAKQFINLLMDVQKAEKAREVILALQSLDMSAEAENAIHILLAATLVQNIESSEQKEELQSIQELYQKSIQFYQKKELKVNAGLVLMDAAQIANLQDDFSNSKEYIQQAITYFKEEEIPEFLGEAGFRKAILLYTWSKNGQPQYYKPAINAFQDVLKIFKRDTHPQKFADIHHNLALIYSEIPVNSDEKPMWAAFSASSFKEALGFYNMKNNPYEFARICHNYATALIHFPEAKLHSNLDKAFQLFEDALQVRTVDKYPMEYASTIINQLELYWLLHNETNIDEQQRIQAMTQKINTVKNLPLSEEMLQKVDFHENKIQSLKTIL